MKDIAAILLAAVPLLASSLANATFVTPSSIEGTPQLGVPYQINWKTIVSSETSDIQKIRLQLGNGDGLTDVKVLFDFATLAFPDTTSYTYTWPTDLPTTNANYTVLLLGLDSKDQVLQTQYITWFHLSAAPVVATGIQIVPESNVKNSTTAGQPASVQTSDGAREKTLSVSIGAFAIALFTIFATAVL